jgi:GH24 family phage-related lysozyme (muramidase)
MPTFDGRRVSGPWKRILTEARAHGVRFLLTSGRRTLAEQTSLFHQNMQLVRGRWVQRPGRPLTAFPSPTAPHIRTGRPDHALDVNALDGGENRLQHWLANHDVISTNPVPGEPWHLEAPAGDLRRLSDRIKAEHAKERDRYRRLNERKPAGRRKISDDGIALIANFEGLRLAAYKPVASEHWYTIGYGHYGPDVKRGMVITKARALELLRRDVKIAEGAVRNLVQVPLRQQEYDALVSFAFNVGNGNFSSSTLLRLLNQRKYRRAGWQFKRWNRDGTGRVLLGLSRRRAAEHKLYRSKRT